MNNWIRYFAFWRARDPERDARDEIEFHIDARVRDLKARGMSEEQAQRVALSEFGDVSHIHDEVRRIDERLMRREERAEWWKAFTRDARVGWRSLRRTPAFTTTAVLCAALGIGVTSAIVSAAFAILVRPLPYADADRLVAIYAENTVRGWKGVNISWPDFISWRDGNRAFTGIGIWTWDSHTLADVGTEAERVQGAEISPNLFHLLGMRPALGRLFLPGEDVEGANRVVLLSDALWHRRFAGDSAIVGKNIMVDGRARTVVASTFRSSARCGCRSRRYPRRNLMVIAATLVQSAVSSRASRSSRRRQICIGSTRSW
jgi:hypothetical protein